MPKSHEIPLQLSDGLHLVTRRIAEISCLPYDSLNAQLSAGRLPYILSRALDRHDVEVMLLAGAIRVVPDSVWESIPSRAEIRRRRREVVLTLTKAGAIRAVTDRSILRLVR